MTDRPTISSPASTGGEGPFFEQHVSAYWLALLLVEGISPIFRDATVSEVSFQNEHLGWATDDVLVIARTGVGRVHRLAMQVKLSLTIGAKNEEFKNTIIDAWADFNNEKIFTAQDDALLIVTQLGTNVLLKDFNTLLDTARSAPTHLSFEERLKTPGFINARVMSHLAEVLAVLDEATGGPVPRAELWQFLRHVYVLSFDLNTGTAQTEALLKTMLALTTQESDPVGAANATWSELLEEVAHSGFEAKQYDREALPSPMRLRHATVSTADRQALATLRGHSDVILKSIRTTIGDSAYIPRNAVVQGVLAQLEDSRVILVAGPAGSGKSAIVKNAAEILGKDHYVFAFRAEELARAHFDETLSAAQVGVPSKHIEALLAAQPRKVVVVESVERLLEASTRDAFSDVLAMVRDDLTWCAILTCRDYSVNHLREAFLGPSALPHALLQIPPLRDEELAEVAQQLPALAPLLQPERLRALLRNPYTLDIAARIDWRGDEPLPESERAFRATFWRMIVRAEDRRARGMPQRRADAFMEICGRRARALSVHGSVADMNGEVLLSLESDGLIVFAPNTKALAAPAHDVLEDWGVLEWISHERMRNNGATLPFATTLGGFPAIRRTYRKWIAELVEFDPRAADALFNEVLGSDALPLHFRDDTIVVFLRSDKATEVLQRHSAKLLANDKELLRRVIHLLRVGCVVLPGWLPPQMSASMLLQPEGNAWPATLELVRKHLDGFSGKDCALLLGLIEDWAKGISWAARYPADHESAAAIGVWLLGFFNRYDSEEALKRTLNVLTKIPASAPGTIGELLCRERDDERDYAAEELQKLVFEGIEGMAIARDLPAVTITSARTYFFATEDDLTDEYRGSSEMELLFGLKDRRSHGFFPPSALRGPFRSLLRSDWTVALSFIIEIFNHSAEWYANRRVSGAYIEEPFEITLRFADGSERKQWCNARLWNLHRGTSTAPYALQSVAMALEAWLFDVADESPDVLDPILLKILRESDSAALTAIAATVATAYPVACGETVLTLLSSMACIRLDRGRMVSDRTGSILGRLAHNDALQQFYSRERAESDARPHRHLDLESAVTRAQAGPLRSRIEETLDRHRAELHPLDEQTESDKIWRLALHRMDLRNYRVTEAPPEVAPPSSDDQEGGPKYILLTGTVPDPDLQQMVDASAAQMSDVNAHLDLQLWGAKVFAGEEHEAYRPDDWNQRLAASRAADERGVPAESIMLYGDGRTLVAAVCLRDHADELREEDREWCLQRVCTEVESGCDAWSSDMGMPSFMNGAVPAAEVIAKIIGEGDVRPTLLHAFACGLVHSDKGVRQPRLVRVGTFGKSTVTSPYGASAHSAVKRSPFKPPSTLSRGCRIGSAVRSPNCGQHSLRSHERLSVGNSRRVMISPSIRAIGPVRTRANGF
jgi:energy-coupling factor transporter ATP-binding protein EcfA2